MLMVKWSFYAKERRRLETNDTCMIKWKLKPCWNDYFTQKECSHAENFYYLNIDVDVGISFSVF